MVISWTDDIFITINIHIDLEAVFLFLLSSARLFIASIPDGVAAQPRPSIFAVIFDVMYSRDLWLFGISGKSLFITGDISFDRPAVIPECSAILSMPHHNGTIPHMVSAISTDSFPDVITASVRFTAVPLKNEKIIPPAIIILHSIFIILCPPPF